MDQKLKKIMSLSLDIPQEQITIESSMDNLEDWDSLAHLSLVINLEEVFGISLSEDEILRMTSYTVIKQILEGKNLQV